MVRDANLLGRFPCELSCPIKKHTLSLLLYAFKYTQYICVYVCCRSLNCLAWLYKSRLEKRKIFTVCWARVMSMRGCCYLQPKKKNTKLYIAYRSTFVACSLFFLFAIRRNTATKLCCLCPNSIRIYIVFTYEILRRTYSHIRYVEHFESISISFAISFVQNVHRITGNLLDFYSGKFRVEQATIDLFQTAISLATMPLTTNDMQKKKKYEEKKPIQPEALNKIYS